MGTGKNIARLIETEAMARMYKKPDFQVEPGHWLYVVTKPEIALLESTGVDMEVIDHLYFYDERYVFFVNGKMNQLLCKWSKNVDAEFIANQDIPLHDMQQSEVFTYIDVDFNANELEPGDVVVGPDENDDLTVYLVQ